MSPSRFVGGDIRFGPRKDAADEDLEGIAYTDELLILY
jgi:hypothetical protein